MRANQKPRDDENRAGETGERRESEFFRPRQGAADGYGQRDRAGDRGGRQFDRQQDEPIGRDIEQAAQRVREGLAEHGVRVDHDRAAAAARAQRCQLIENEGAARQTASTAAAANPSAKRRRCAGSVPATRIGAAMRTAIANVTPPTKLELSKPATTMSISTASSDGLCSLGEAADQQYRRHRA